MTVCISDLIDDLLRANGQIANIWSLEDVRCHRPDLSEDEAWKVLEFIDRNKNAEVGITWETINLACQYLHGEPKGGES